jgi:hypothetical protein
VPESVVAPGRSSRRSDRASGETVVVGGTWAALVAAERLAAAGEDVRLLLPARGVGGGFAPRRVDGRALELGLRVLELDHEAAPPVAEAPPLEHHDAAGDGHLPYLPLIADYLRGLAGEELVTLAPAATAVGGRLVDDLFLTSDPAGIRSALTPAQRAAAAAEVDPSTAPGALRWPAEQRTLAAASRENHGPTVHETLIAPFVDKVVAGGADAVLAAYRRRVWTPVLWPRSVWESCSGAPLGYRPQRPQQSVRGGVGVLVDRVLARIGRDPRIAVEVVGALDSIVAAPAAVRLRFAGGRDLLARRPVLAVPAAELFAAAGVAFAPDRARTVVAWVEADGRDVLAAPPVVHVVDRAIDALRITTGVDPVGVPEGRRLFCVELRHDLAEEAIPAAARAGLERVGLLREGAALQHVSAAAARTFPLPTRANVDAFAAARRAFADLALDAEVIGGATGPAGDYLNEQVAAGMACAARRSTRAGVATTA